MTDEERNLLSRAWETEGSLRRLGLLPAADKVLQAFLIPPGGGWQCVAPDGCITRSIRWDGREVALVNPKGDLTDGVEGEVAMGLRAAPLMDMTLRGIFILARDAANLDLICRMARAAIDYIEQPAPKIPGAENDEEC